MASPTPPLPKLHSLITFQAPAGFYQQSKANNLIPAIQEGQASCVGMGITPQHHWSPRMSPKAGTRCWGDTRPHSLGLVLPSTAPRGAAGPGQSQGKEWHGSSPDLPWGVSGRGFVSLQVVPGGFPCTGTGRSRQLPKALGVGQCPQCGLAAPVPPGILGSFLPSLKKKSRRLLHSFHFPSTRAGGLPDTSRGLLVSLGLTSCNFLINTWILPVQSHLIEHKVTTECPHKPPPGHWVTWRTQGIPILGTDHGKETLFDVKTTLHKFLQNSPSSHTAKLESKPPIITKKAPSSQELLTPGSSVWVWNVSGLIWSCTWFYSRWWSTVFQQSTLFPSVFYISWHGFLHGIALPPPTTHPVPPKNPTTAQIRKKTKTPLTAILWNQNTI